MKYKIQGRDETLSLANEYGASRRIYDATPEDVSYIGHGLKVFDGDCLADSLECAASQINDVMSTSAKHIATARGQIEDAVGDVSRLSDRDIAIMDVRVREILAESARDVVDPFNGSGSYSFHLGTIEVPALDLRKIFDIG